MLLRLLFPMAVLCLGVPAVLQAQPHVDAENLRETVIVVVPITGKGTYADPFRPMVIQPSGTEYFRWEPSDDGKLAIVEMTAPKQDSFSRLTVDTRIVKTFHRGRAKRGDIERELRLIKKDFTLDRTSRRRP